MTDQQVYDLVQQFYKACVNQDEAEESRLLCKLEQFYQRYNVDTVGDLEEKLIPLLVKIG